MEAALPKATLYAIPGSHACEAGALMLEYKGIPYRRVNLSPGFHSLSVRLRGFPGHAETIRTLDHGERTSMVAFGDRLGTVPALKLGDERVQTNCAIARRLDELRPAPPLFPADPELRRGVEEAETWADEEFQMFARRLALAAVLHGPDAMHDRAGDGRLGPLLWKNDTMRRVGTRFLGRFAFDANLETEGEMLAAFPAMLDRIDAWIEAGVLNGEDLNAADFMIAGSLAMLAYRRDLRPEIEARPAGALVEHAFAHRAT